MHDLHPGIGLEISRVGGALLLPLYRGARFLRHNHIFFQKVSKIIIGSMLIDEQNKRALVFASNLWLIY